MADATASMRIDRFLWFARIAPTRKIAQAMASAGTLRIDGRATDRPAALVRVGSVLAFVTHRGKVRVLRVDSLPGRRGPAQEAAAHYSELANPS